LKKVEKVIRPEYELKAGEFHVEQIVVKAFAFLSLSNQSSTRNMTNIFTSFPLMNELIFSPGSYEIILCVDFVETTGG
jgi:hypothetical protein